MKYQIIIPYITNKILTMAVSSQDKLPCHMRPLQQNPSRSACPCLTFTMARCWPAIVIHLTCMKKFLKYDRLRAKKFQGNKMLKKGNTVICTEVLIFGSVLLMYITGMISHEILKNTYTILISFSKTSNSTWKTYSCMFFPNYSQDHAITYTKNLRQSS